MIVIVCVCVCDCEFWVARSHNSLKMCHSERLMEWLSRLAWWWVFIVIAAIRVDCTHWFHVTRYVMFGWRVMSFWCLQQMITVSLISEMRQSMLTVDEYAAATSQRSSAHFEYLDGRIRWKDEIFVCRYKHKDYDECTAHDHAVGKNRNRCRCKNRSKVNPTTNWRR